MPTTAHEHGNHAPDGRLHVAVGVVRRRDCLLVQQRPLGKPSAGLWEFPGGKVEPNESPYQALEREIAEELGIAVQTGHPLLILPFDYPHIRVWLEVFVVDTFIGTVTGREGQLTRWLLPAQIRQLPILQAVEPILVAVASLEEAEADSS